MNDFILYSIFCLAFLFSIELLFFLNHNRPLTDYEIYGLMEKRKKKYIKKHYKFRGVNSFPTDDFKSSMNPSGELYPADLTLDVLPSFVANLLKWKKHEWIVIAFVKDDFVGHIYTNKGYDNESVYMRLDPEELMDICREYGYQTVICFHNHPNSDPSKYDCLLPSAQDRQSAKYYSDILTSNGISWLEFVCERGLFLEYWRAFSVLFFPADSDYYWIQKENQNAKKWYRLQHELGYFRLFLKKKANRYLPFIKNESANESEDNFDTLIDTVKEDENPRPTSQIENTSLDNVAADDDLDLPPLFDATHLENTAEEDDVLTLPLPLDNTPSKGITSEENNINNTNWDFTKEIEEYFLSAIKRHSGKFTWALHTAEKEIFSECGYVFISTDREYDENYHVVNEENTIHFDPNCSGYSAMKYDTALVKKYGLCPKCKSYKPQNARLSQSAIQQIKNSIEAENKYGLEGSVSLNFLYVLKKNGFVFVAADGRVYHNNPGCSDAFIPVTKSIAAR